MGVNYLRLYYRSLRFSFFRELIIGRAMSQPRGLCGLRKWLCNPLCSMVLILKGKGTYVVDDKLTLPKAISSSSFTRCRRLATLDPVAAGARVAG